MPISFRAAHVAAIVIATLGCATAARAQSSNYSITVSQVGNDVVVAGTGSINLTGLTFVGSTNVGLTSDIQPYQMLLGNLGLASIYSGLISSYGAPFASSSALAQSDNGAGFAINNSLEELLVPQGYVSGTNLDSSSTFDNTTLAALGLNSGIYSWTWLGTNSIDLDIPPSSSSSGGSSTVPEPSSLAILGLPVIALLLARRGVAAAR